MSTIAVVAIIIFIVVDIIGACLMAKAAGDKGYSSESAGIICFFLGIFGYLYVVALPDLNARSLQRQILDALTDGEKNSVVKNYKTQKSISETGGGQRANTASDNANSDALPEL
jgi:hypothetical protein